MIDRALGVKRLMFDKILNWRLLSGSHKFPGPDGGTCINEAAVVAAGFEYSAVRNVDDCPPCFSRVIARYAIRLNDAMPDDLRQELLMPFVARLAGTADVHEKEIERARYIAFENVKRILPIVLLAIGPQEDRRHCEQANALNAAAATLPTYPGAALAAAVAYRGAAIAADAAAQPAAAARFGTAAYRAVDVAAVAFDYSGAAVDAAASVVEAAGYANPAAGRQIFTVATAIFDEAIKLGKQAEPIETALVVSRMNALKEKARECV